MSIVAILMLAAAQPSAAAPAAPASDGVKTSETGGVGSVPALSDEILAAIGDCTRAVHQHGKVDWDVLKTAGWQFGGKQTAPARPPMPAIQQVFFGKGNVINIVQSTGISASCQTIATVTDPAASEREVRAGITGTLKAVAAKDYKGDDIFKAGVERMAPGSLAKTMISDTNRYVVATNSKGGKSSIMIQMTPKITDK